MIIEVDQFFNFASYTKKERVAFKLGMDAYKGGHGNNANPYDIKNEHLMHGRFLDGWNNEDFKTFKRRRKGEAPKNLVPFDYYE